jgi:hypothetical protein
VNFLRNVSVVTLALCLPAAALAQPSAAITSSSSRTTKGFAAVHVSGQAASASLSDTFTFRIYDEAASVTNDQDYGAGFLFNIEGGYRVLPRLTAGLAITHASGDAETRLSASIPHPQVFDAPRSATFDVSDANHRETGYHIFVSYLFPVTTSLDLRVFAGPSIYQVSHDLVSGVAFTDTAPFTSVTITDATRDERSETVGAFHVGAGATYQVTDRFGVDGFFRFARRTVDLPGVTASTTELEVGGAQVGLGIRVAF